MKGKAQGIAGFKNGEDFIDYRMQCLKNSDRSMSALYEIMFSEKDNIMFEESDGFRIIKTTYGEVKERADKMSGNIRKAIGEKQGSIVGVYMDNSPLMIAVFWAILKAGFNPLFINMRLPDSVVEKSATEMNVAAIISDGKQFNTRTILARDIREEECDDANNPFGTEFYVMSSGSSSVKVCAYTSERIVQIIENSSYVLKKNKNFKNYYDGQLKLLAFLPFYHIFGFVAVYLWFAFFARVFVKLNNLSPSVIQNTIKRHKVTHIFAVPLFWNTVRSRAMAEITARGEKIAQTFDKGIAISSKLGNSPLGKLFRKFAFKEVRDGLFGESICCMITGGSSISSDTLEFFNGIGYPLLNGYGMSEAGITSVELSYKYKDIVSCSIGNPFPSVSYKIEDGVLYVKGASTASYIVENGNVTSLEDNWYKTSDLAEKRDGRYYLLGRADDLITSVTGENLNPSQIENELSVKGVDEICLIGGVNGSLPVLLVSTGTNVGKDRANEIISCIKEKIEKNNLVSQIGKICIVFEPLVKGDEFKLNRKRLKKDYYEGRLKMLSNDNPDNDVEMDELTQKIREYFAVALSKQTENVGYTTDFFLDEGGTSIDYFALIAKLQQDFNIEFPQEAGAGINTVEGMAQYIKVRI